MAFFSFAVHFQPEFPLLLVLPLKSVVAIPLLLFPFLLELSQLVLGHLLNGILCESHVLGLLDQLLAFVDLYGKYAAPSFVRVLAQIDHYLILALSAKYVFGRRFEESCLGALEIPSSMGLPVVLQAVRGLRHRL